MIFIYESEVVIELHFAEKVHLTLFFSPLGADPLASSMPSFGLLLVLLFLPLSCVARLYGEGTYFISHLRQKAPFHSYDFFTNIRESFMALVLLLSSNLV